MAWTEAERVQIRRWMGSSHLFNQLDPRLENAMSAVQSQSDGGNQPTSDTEGAIRGWLGNLDTIEAAWLQYVGFMEAGKADEVAVDPIRGVAGQQRLGRMYVGFIADALSMRPRRDVFASPHYSGQMTDYSNLR